MKRFLLSLLLIAIIPALLLAQNNSAYREKILIVKIKPAFTDAFGNGDFSAESIATLQAKLGVDVLFQKFPKAQKPTSNQRNAQDPFADRQVDISRIYEWKYTADISVPKAVIVALKSGIFEYVEPAYIYQISFVPSDELAYKQYHLENIRAYEAFDIDTGSADVTIGVVDTGIDWDHEDLVDAIRYNENDLFDGIDNDSNGFVDDFRGWNFYDDNNDPDEKSWSHGTHVSGLAAASTNNEIGVVGTSFSSKVLPVKAGSHSQITHGYEGVVYAADMGCGVINCSWGGNVASAFGLDIVQYATYNKKAILLGGAGNQNLDTKFYPASYEEVISVGGTDSNDFKYEASNYNFDVDIIAPGRLIYSTKNGTYDTESGTSMSSPITAGAAALVRARFPELSPLQVKAHLQNTANKLILAYAENLPYAEKLGSGLLDMRAALDTVSSPFITAEEIKISDNDDEVYNIGDEIQIGFELVNYLIPSQALTVTLRPIDSNNNVLMIDSVWTLNGLGTNQRTNNYTSPFKFELIAENGSYNQPLSFRILITDGSYSTVDFAEMVIKPDYVNVNENNILATITSNGNVGFTGDFFRRGDGFEHNVIGNVLYEGGLMIGYKSNVRKKVVDRIRGTADVDRDFTAQNVITQVNPQGLEAFRAEGSFVDTSATADEIGLEIHQTVTAFSDEGHLDYVILEYEIINKSGQDLDSIYVGYFADWDIEDPSKNRGETVFPVKMGYVKNIYLNEFCAGIQLLSDQQFNSYMIDNGYDGAGGINPNDGDRFSTDDKYEALSNNRFQAGTMSGGNDVIQVLSTKGQFLANSDTLRVKFALLATDGVGALTTVAYNAYQRENGYNPGQNVEGEIAVNSIYPNPVTNTVNLDFDLKNKSEISFAMYNLQGKIVQNFGSKSFFEGSNKTTLDASKLNTGVYFLKIYNDNIDLTFPIEKVKY